MEDTTPVQVVQGQNLTLQMVPSYLTVTIMITPQHQTIFLLPKYAILVCHWHVKNFKTKLKTTTKSKNMQQFQSVLLLKHEILLLNYVYEDSSVMAR